jgi:hypothetical protein
MCRPQAGHHRSALADRAAAGRRADPGGPAGATRHWLRHGGRVRRAALRREPAVLLPEAQFSRQAVTTAPLVALACLLVRSFDLGSPASTRRRDSRRTAAETTRVSVDSSTRPTPSAPAAAVSRTTMLAFSALRNTDVLTTSRRMSRPDIGLAMMPTVASTTSRWRLTRQPLACCSPIALPARRRRACRLRETRFRSRWQGSRSSSDKTRLIPAGLTYADMGI